VASIRSLVKSARKPRSNINETVPTDASNEPVCGAQRTDLSGELANMEGAIANALHAAATQPFELGALTRLDLEPGGVQ
jgi:hypothetical protein